MLLNQLEKYREKIPGWFLNVCLEEQLDSNFHLNDGILTRSDKEHSHTQKQTSDSFGYQWQKKTVFEHEDVSDHVKTWLTQRFGAAENHFKNTGPDSVLLDAGCGASMSALAYFGSENLAKINYVGLDVSEAVNVAKKRFEENKLPNSFFMRSDLNNTGLKKESVDIIFSEGVLHHTDDAGKAFDNLATLLKPDGRFIFYVYKKKAPIREFSDDFIRNALVNLGPEEKYQALFSLTKLGKKLGDLNLEIDIESPIEFLDIPAGKIDIQRFFFYYIFKCFYKKEWSIDQMNLTNYDWYSPKNCSRHTKEEVREWVKNKGMLIEKEYEDDSGLSYIVKYS